MSERPILFSAPMIRAILAGAKTVTRRIVRLGPAESVVGVSGDPNPPPRPFVSGSNGDRQPLCPYGYPGDSLWVRETFCLAGPNTWSAPKTVNPKDCYEAAYYAAVWDRSAPTRWRPSIHMPRWASRITLEVTGVRVERLQDLTEEDAKAEGVAPSRVLSAREEFERLWGVINAKRAPWSSNPWVWRVEFKRVA